MAQMIKVFVRNAKYQISFSEDDVHYRIWKNSDGRDFFDKLSSAGAAIRNVPSLKNRNYIKITDRGKLLLKIKEGKVVQDNRWNALGKGGREC